jgi:hypothetical protein
MRKIRKIINVSLIVLTGFLSLTSISGGIALLTGFYAPPVSQLEGTIFKSFLIPGIALSVIVGGSSFFAAMLLIYKNRFSSLISTVTGIVIMFFEFIEVLMIGSPHGAARTLQIFYFSLGTIIAIFSIFVWFIDIYLNINSGKKEKQELV